MPPRPSAIRHRVDPADIPAEKAARRLGLTPAQFSEKLAALIDRGFPPADPTTGNYDLDAIDLWRKFRNPRLYGLTGTLLPVEAVKPTIGMGERFHEAKKRGRHDTPA